jgi:excisionase family DNA binding protein
MSTPASRPNPATRRARAAVSSTTAPPRIGEPEAGPAEDRLAYSVDEAARLTGLSRDLLYDQMRRGKLLYIKVGRRRVITRQHLEQFLDIASTSTAYQPGRARN